MKSTKTTNRKAEDTGRDALGRTPAERDAFIKTLSGVIREREAREMKEPLRKAEIRAGVARLMSSPYMKSAEGRKGDEGAEDDWTGALDTASDVRSNSGPRLFPFAEKWGLEGNVPGIIEDLGFTLIAQRTSVEEIFRLGTSPEAIALLEKNATWWAERVKAHHAGSAAAGGAA